MKLNRQQEMVLRTIAIESGNNRPFVVASGNHTIEALHRGGLVEVNKKTLEKVEVVMTDTGLQRLGRSTKAPCS
jgi:hypothetical protein